MIAVLMGGYSAEREISLMSGMAIYDALVANNVECFAFDLTADNIKTLWDKKFDKAFIVLHGRGGEDGYIQSLLEGRGIPFTGSNSSASALCMNKAITKEFGNNIFYLYRHPLLQAKKIRQRILIFSTLGSQAHSRRIQHWN